MIKFFIEEYKGLSNFEPCPIFYKHKNFPTLEHAYQASKTVTDEAYIYAISKLPANKAGVAKKWGKVVKLRLDWKKVKLRIMENFLRQKFSQLKFKTLLLSTRDEYLEEGNWWDDNFWGNCHCKKCIDKEGQNNLGKLLMKIRGDLEGG
jgi:hypothetical protein